MPSANILQDMMIPKPIATIELDRASLQIPLYLRSVVVGQDREAFNYCNNRFMNAFNHMGPMQRRRELCYTALCPQTDTIRYVAHVESIKRLWSWWGVHISTNPALAPEPKIPHQTMKICIAREAYEEFTKEYYRELEEFMTGAYQEWLDAKEKARETIWNSRNISHMDWHMWQSFWDSSYLYETGKWEKCISELQLPSYNELVEEIYWAIIQRVEDGERLAQKFWLCGTTAP